MCPWPDDANALESFGSHPLLVLRTRDLALRRRRLGHRPFRLSIVMNVWSQAPEQVQHFVREGAPRAIARRTNGRAARSVLNEVDDIAAPADVSHPAHPRTFQILGMDLPLSSRSESIISCANNSSETNEAGLIRLAGLESVQRGLPSHRRH